MAAPDDVSADRSRRPRDLALLLLATADEAPRARARDQQADLAGGALRRRVLDRLAALDPDPDGLDEALASIVADLDGPSGPTRAICSRVRQEWDECEQTPGAWSWLLSEAVAAADREPGRRGGRRAPS